MQSLQQLLKRQGVVRQSLRRFCSFDITKKSSEVKPSSNRDINQVPSFQEFAQKFAETPSNFDSPPSDPVFPPDALSEQASEELTQGQSPPLAGKKYFIETYGCQMNEADSEIVRSILNTSGMTAGASLDESDVVLLNTCSIRENAEMKVFNRLNEIKAQKKKLKRKDLFIGVLGCMAERLKVELVEKNKAVDLVVGPDAYRDLPNLLQELMVR